MTESLSPNEFLTPEESAEVDKALLSSRERFSTRVAIYCLRSLKQISQSKGIAIETISNQQIAEWVKQDERIQQPSSQGLATDPAFEQFFVQLVISSLKPLRQIAQDTNIPIENLMPTQVIAWFEKEAKVRIEQGN